MYPVHIKYPGTAIPAEGTCFIIAKEGILLRRETSWMHATVPVESIGVLDSVPIGVQLQIPLISAEILHEVIAFLRAAYKRYQTEAIILLYYSDEFGWEIDVPPQKVSRYTISSYDTTLQMQGYKCLGSVHSHADLAASHSGVDHADEAEFDGIHITIGHCQNQFGVSVSAEVVVNGNRFKYPLHETEGIKLTDALPGVYEFRWDKKESPRTYITLAETPAEFPLEWLERIEAQATNQFTRMRVPGPKVTPTPSPVEVSNETEVPVLPTEVVSNPVQIVSAEPATVEPVPIKQLSLRQRARLWLEILKHPRRK